MVGVIMPCCVTVRVVAWLQWVSLCHVVLQLGLLHGHGGCCHAMLCHGHDGCVTWCGVAVTVSALHGGVVVVVIALHVVLWALHHVWCYRHHTVCGVVGVTPCKVLWASWASHHVVSQALLHVWYHSYGCCTMWCCGYGGCCHATWDHSDWTTKEEISRKKRKEKKKNILEGSVVAAPAHSRLKPKP